MKVVIFGSRRIVSLEDMEKAVEASNLLHNITEIVSGCAGGVDTSAIKYAEKHNLPVKLSTPNHCFLFPLRLKYSIWYYSAMIMFGYYVN